MKVSQPITRNNLSLLYTIIMDDTIIMEMDNTIIMEMDDTIIMEYYIRL